MPLRITNHYLSVTPSYHPHSFGTLLTNPYDQAFKNIGNAFSTMGDHSLIDRAVHLVAGAILLIPLVNVIAYFAMDILFTRTVWIDDNNNNMDPINPFVDPPPPLPPVVVPSPLRILYQDAERRGEINAALQSSFAHSFTTDQWESLDTFLGRLIRRSSLVPPWYQGAAKAETAALLIECLELAKIDASFKEQFFYAVDQAGTNCQDRRSYYMNSIYYYYCAARGSFPMNMSRIDFIVGLRRIQLLEREADIYRNGPDDTGGESVARGLYLQRKLKEAFKLPLFTTAQRYRSYGRIDNNAFEGIASRVMEQTNDRKAILVENELWKEYVRQRFSDDATEVLMNNPLPDKNPRESQDDYDIRCIPSRMAMETALNRLIDSNTDILMREIEGV